MTTNEPRALADLARALRAASLLIRSMSANGGDETIAEELADSTHYAREAGHWDDDWDWEQVATILDTWQAPPSPDAGGAFAAAVEELASAQFQYGFNWPVKPGDTEQQRAWDAKAALLAFAPGVRITPTITDADVEAAAEELNRIYSDYKWSDIRDDMRSRIRGHARAVLEAVAAARQKGHSS